VPLEDTRTLGTPRWRRDFDDDGTDDALVWRGVGRRFSPDSGGAVASLLYVNLSSDARPSHASTYYAYLTSRGSNRSYGTSTTATAGDRVLTRVIFSSSAEDTPVTRVLVYVDSDGDGRLTESDALVAERTQDGAPSYFAWRTQFAVDATWGTGARAVFMVAEDAAGVRSIPATAMLVLV
jgi:hypothetical protein